VRPAPSPLASSHRIAIKGRDVEAHPEIRVRIRGRGKVRRLRAPSFPPEYAFRDATSTSGVLLELGEAHRGTGARRGAARRGATRRDATRRARISATSGVPRSRTRAFLDASRVRTSFLLFVSLSDSRHRACRHTLDAFYFSFPRFAIRVSLAIAHRRQHVSVMRSVQRVPVCTRRVHSRKSSLPETSRDSNGDRSLSARSCD